MAEELTFNHHLAINLNRHTKILLFLICLMKSLSFDKTCDDKCGQSKHIFKRIIGGERTVIEKFPWMVELRPYKKYVACGGALINRCFVLTAAHCFKRHPDGKEIIVTLGTDKYYYTNAIVRVATEKIRYPTYEKNSTHDDIMLLRLNESVEYSNDIQPICLPVPFYNYTAQIAMVMGFGVKSYRGSFSDTLRVVDLEVLSNNRCRNAFKEVEILPTYLCAGGEKGKDACQGDSGSPLVVNQNGRYSIIGIVSWGVHCAEKGYPGVYTRVSSYIDWIKNVTMQYPECCPAQTINENY